MFIPQQPKRIVLVGFYIAAFVATNEGLECHHER